jgi:serine/threonine-protein kinase
VPEDLDAICLKALDGSPARRYPTGAELRADVGRWLARRPVEARVPTTWYRARKFVARHRLPVAAAAALLLVLTIGVIAIWTQVSRADRERARAEQALTESLAVGDFLMGLFEAPDPSLTRGEEPAVRDLLERGARRADQLTAQPLLQARMLDTIGRVYQSLGHYEGAEPLLRRALATRQQQHPGGHPDVAASLHSLAHFLHVRGAYDEAEQRYREALQMRRHVLQAPHADTAETLARFGLFQLRVRNDQGGAEALLRESLVMRRAALGDNHPKVASALRELGAVFTARKDFAGAERHYRDALAIHRTQLGPTHPETIVTLNNLGTALAARGDMESAERTFREVLEANRRVLGHDHPGVAVNLNNLATVLQRRRQPREAETLYREALAINERSLGGTHPSVAWVAANLARAIADTGRFAEAEALYRRAEDIYATHLPPGHNARRELHGRMASLYRAWKKDDLAGRFETLAASRPAASPSDAAAAQSSATR